MSPYPLDPVAATGPMRVVVCVFPSPGPADGVIEKALRARLAACANQWPIRSRYWWKGTIESADEVLVWFKTVPKHVGALCRLLEREHPYDVPEILELDVPRVNAPYLRYLAATIDARAPPLPLGGGSGSVRHRVGRRAPAARRPGRTRGRPRPR